MLVVGAIGETIGWAGRLWSGVENDYSNGSYNAFLMQICVRRASRLGRLLRVPHSVSLSRLLSFRRRLVRPLLSHSSFRLNLADGIFTLLVAHISSETSRFRPRTLVKVFVGADVLSLVLQAAGGGIASEADDGSDTQKAGTNVFVAGIAFQLGASVFSMPHRAHLRQPRCASSRS